MPPSKAAPNGVEIRLPASAEDLPPTAPRTIGRYQLLKRLGAGGMGVVYAAMAPEGRAVAIKTVHAEYAENADFRARFAREVDLLRRVGGACVVPLIDADTTADRPWLVTLLIEGPTLGAFVGGHGPLGSDLLRGLAVGVAEAPSSASTATEWSTATSSPSTSSSRRPAPRFWISVSRAPSTRPR